MEELKPIDFTDVDLSLFKDDRPRFTDPHSSYDYKSLSRKYAKRGDGHTRRFFICLFGIPLLIGWTIGYDVGPFILPILIFLWCFVPLMIISGIISYFWTKHAEGGCDKGTKEDIVGGVVGGIVSYTILDWANQEKRKENMKHDI